MNDNLSGQKNELVPDFAWPFRIAELLAGWISTQWNRLLDELASRLPTSPMTRFATRAVVWSCFAYIALVWVCLCYIRFPISPYGLWEIVKWVAIVTVLTAVMAYGVISAVLAGSGTIALLVLLFFSAIVYFSLSLFYLCWIIGGALRKRSSWLHHYRSVILTGLMAILVLATFVDGSYRFWDRPFAITAWVKIVLISAAAWATLFCGLVRNKAMQPGTPHAVVKWTIGLTIGIGLLVLWGAGSKAEYLLHKNFVEHPKDANAWLRLAAHYHEEAERLEATSGDEDNAPPDPMPSYRAALNCLNKAADLGAGSFEVHCARAQLAEMLGERRDAVTFGRQALSLAPVSRDASAEENEKSVKWLNEMLARNASVESDSQSDENSPERVRGHRRDALPGIVRWVFRLL